MGAILGAEFLVAVGNICAFSSADRLAAYAGLVPAARDSGKRVGNDRRMWGHPGEDRGAIRGHRHLIRAVSLEPSPILRGTDEVYFSGTQTP
jgi:hypothetical protein